MSAIEINKIQEEIIDNFSFFESWDEKYALIIDYGKSLPPLDECFKKEENKIKGCQSQVWLVAAKRDGKLIYKADSDAIITKGLIALLLQVYSNKDVDAVLESEPYFIEKIGMNQHLSPTRSNGLASMVKQIKYYALALKGV